MTVLYIFLQFTWGIIQNVFGMICIFINIKFKHYFYHGAIVTNWNKNESMGMGMFIFIGNNVPGDKRYPNRPMQETVSRTLVHEYGHTIQSIILGPLFLLVIGLPSSIWAFCSYFQKIRKEKDMSYFSAYQERWANHLGELVTKEKSMGDAIIDF